MAKAEAARPDGIEAVAIVTPNHLHHAAACVFLDAGIHVICDKPLTRTLDEAIDLVARVKKSGLLFGVTYTYSGYPMVRLSAANWATSAWFRSNTRKTGWQGTSNPPARNRPCGAPTRPCRAKAAALATLAPMLTTSPVLSLDSKQASWPQN